MAGIASLIGPSLTNAQGDRIDSSSLNGKYVALYFSAKWCGPCRAFTPELASAYRILRQDRKQFEVVFASGDRSVDEYRSYLSEMPWLAMPFDQSRVQTLMAQHGVRGYPTVLVFGPDGQKVSSDGRELFARNGARAYDMLVSQYGAPSGGLAGRSGGYTLSGGGSGGGGSDGGSASGVPLRARFQPPPVAAGEGPMRDISQTVARVVVALLIIGIAWKLAQGPAAL